MTGSPLPPSSGSDVLGRGARSAMALGLRQAVVQALSLAGAVALARLLTPAEFGIYGITVFVLQFLVVFGDAGLAAGLVREEAEPSEADFRAVFTFQQVLVAALVTAAALLSPVWNAWMEPGSGIGPLLAAAMAALVLASFQTLPAARLERHLRFDRLAVVEVAQAVAFNAVAVGAALAGLGASSMAVALVARAATGAVAMQLVSPWRTAWGWDFARVRRRLRFGLAYQGSSFVSMAAESLVPVFVGATIGHEAVGGLFFARMLAFHPFVVVAMVQRVMLPMFARLQSRPAELARAASATLLAVSALAVPVQATVLALEEPLVRIVFGEQWLEWLGVFRLLWVAALLEPPLLVAVAMLNALGRSGRTLRYIVEATALTWAAGVPLLMAFGVHGYGLALLLLLVLKAKLVREADAVTGNRSFATMALVWTAAAAGGGAAALLVRLYPPAGLGGLAAAVATSLAVDAVALALLAPGPARAAWRRIAALRQEAAA